MRSNLKIYSYSLCGSCRKAIKWLDANSIQYELIDIINSPPPKKIIIESIEQLGDRKYILNTSGKSYRTIGSKQIKSMKDKEVIELLLLDGKLIKRPFVVNSDGKILVGFNEARWEDFFLS